MIGLKGLCWQVLIPQFLVAKVNTECVLENLDPEAKIIDLNSM